MTLRLTLTSEQDHHLHESLSKTRSGTKTVTVDKDALQNLLFDFGKALSMTRGGYRTAEGKQGP